MADAHTAQGTLHAAAHGRASAEAAALCSRFTGGESANALMKWVIHFFWFNTAAHGGASAEAAALCPESTGGEVNLKM